MPPPTPSTRPSTPTPRARERPRQDDIARALGLSVSTVSRALADSELVNADVKRRVREAAASVGYPVKTRGGAAPLDEVVVMCAIAAFRETRSTVYFALLDGIKEEAARVAGGVRTVMGADGDPVPAEIDAALGPGTGCVFLGVTPAEGTARALAGRGVPTVVANGIDEALVVDSISPANHAGGAIVAGHLLGLGHRRLGYLSGVRRQTLHRRLAGFRQGVEAGPGDASMRELRLPGDISDAHGDAFRDWMLGEARGITALTCYNDGAAVWAMERLHRMGLSVPGDVSVAGFDDMAIAQIASPSLTTFRIDWAEIGRQTVRMLHRRMLEPGAAVHFLQVGGALVARQSTAPPAG